MDGTSTRTAHVDRALARLGKLVERPWDSKPADDGEPYETDPTTPPDRERRPRWWRDHPAADLLRRAGPRRVPIALVVGVVAVLAIVAYLLLSGPPAPEAAPDLAAATVETSRAPTSARPAEVVVDVVGKVQAPGVRSLPSGSRVRDALTAAGGATSDADLSTLNLARPLVDGEQVRVGLPQLAVPGPAAAGTAGPVDLNSATVAQLDELPGVGAVTAQRILDWRERHGRFSSVAQLQEVDGIGPARFESLRELVVVP